VNVCLTCFNGSCEDTTDHLHNHTAVHYKATSHPVLLNVRRVSKIRSEDAEPPKKLTKLEIVAEEPESEKYDFHTSVHCLQCNLSIPTDQANVPSPIYKYTDYGV
jgi:ubiquitin carboxyl-terminal hydrolase 5/13